MTDPNTLDRNQLIAHVTALQKSIIVWQKYAARLRGISVEQMIGEMRGAATEISIAQLMDKKINDVVPEPPKISVSDLPPHLRARLQHGDPLDQ